ncbi:hypothetical protein TIFTF001_028986 [Ficus carica]|uniref:F-box domain containing protein n=1 Tax=Ficus carica TaxID=3494 RepID=A0AA88DQZ7_FICCA|nr:hypothetical protein TIFTF001_028986 [Ficus carica]
MLELGGKRRSERLRLRQKTRDESERPTEKRICKQRANNGERQQSERIRIVNGERESSSHSSAAESVVAVSEAAAKFMSVVSDDLLQEILFRLPHSKIVIQCGTVCKRWFSLVTSRSQGGLYYIRKFNHHHRLKRQQQQERKQVEEHLPYTLLMTSRYSSGGDDLQFSYCPYTPCNNFFSDKSKILRHGKVSLLTTGDGHDGYLDFLPWPSRVIKSSFDDLLLIMPNRKEFLICNPLTRQWILLPWTRNFPDLDSCGFVCKPNCNCNSQFGGSYSYSYSNNYCNCRIKYRVVLISRLHDSVSVFSSETGQWTESTLQFPETLYDWHATSVGNNGILYWALGVTQLKGIVALNAFKDGDDLEEKRCRLICLPVEFARGFGYGHSKRARLGVVRGRLRLAQVYFLKRSDSYVLKAWELVDDHRNASWDLVHHVRFKRSDKSVLLFLVALHPDDGDAVFLTSGNNGETECQDLFQYKIGSDDVEPVCKGRYGSCVFPLVHPWWPTTIPSLPPSN